MGSNISGYANVAIAQAALSQNKRGTGNNANGYLTLYFNTASKNTVTCYNTALGEYSDITTHNLSNATAVGFLAYVDASNKVVVGKNFVTSIGGQIGWTNYSDEKIKQDIKEGFAIKCMMERKA